MVTAPTCLIQEQRASTPFRLKWGAMITGELKSKIDAVWNDFWSGGISNPLEVMEQLTYLLFIKALDERQTLAENKANRTGLPIDEVIFPEGEEFLPEGLARGRPYGALRWSRFKHLAAVDMFEVVGNYVFPFLHRRAEESTHAEHMRGARLTIPTPGLLQKAVDGLDAIPMADRDTKGDVYEYMLSRIATAGQNGQFRTPRHIIRLMVEMVAPQPDDVICDPASGTCGFLVAAGEYIRSRHPSALTDAAKERHFHSGMFSGYDFDNTMLRIGSMNMQLHGVQDPTISYRDSLAEDHAGDAEAYSLILAKQCIAGQLAYLRPMTALCCPTVNSYKRLAPAQLCGYWQNWGHDHRCTTVRVNPERGSSAWRTASPTRRPARRSRPPRS